MSLGERTAEQQNSRTAEKQSSALKPIMRFTQCVHRKRKRIHGKAAWRVSEGWRVKGCSNHNNNAD